MFQPGQRIVCINDQFDPIQQATIPNLPQQDNVYVVRDAFQVTRNGTSSGIWALHLRELRNPMLPHPSGLGSFEPSFAAERFSRLKDDYAEVEEMLENLVKEQELELV